jgi:hypothetical protein
MSVPGVGPIITVAFLSTIDDPEQFRHLRDFGPYLGLMPTRYQSGEISRRGPISKCGDAFTRTCLYEAANVLLTKVQRFSLLKVRGIRLVQRIGAKKARVAVVRKIAVILRCIWVDGTEFWWSRQDGLTRHPPSRLRAGGEAVSAETVGGGDRVQPVNRSSLARLIRPPQTPRRPTPAPHHRQITLTSERTMTSATAASSGA